MIQKFSGKDTNYDGFTPDKPPIEDEIPCKKCKQGSGYFNNEIRTIHVETIKTYHCKNCGNAVIKFLPTSANEETLKHDRNQR